MLSVNFAFEIGDNLEMVFPAFPGGGAIVKWLVLLAVVLIAHGAYRIVAETFLGEYAWIYSLVLLGFALVPLINLVLLSYQNIDKLIDITMAGLRTVGGGGMSQARGQRQCANCGAALAPGAKFCRECGAAAPVQEATDTNPTQCLQCGAALHPGSKFCPECGVAVG